MLNIALPRVLFSPILHPLVYQLSARAQFSMNYLVQAFADDLLLIYSEERCGSPNCNAQGLRCRQLLNQIASFLNFHKEMVDHSFPPIPVKFFSFHYSANGNPTSTSSPLPRNLAYIHSQFVYASHAQLSLASVLSLPFT